MSQPPLPTTPPEETAGAAEGTDGPVLGNLFADVPAVLQDERIEALAGAADTRILRIVSIGHMTPAGTWYDQPDTEWVALLQGQASLRFEQQGLRTLQAGDYVTIPAGCRHRVEWTSSEPPAVWLAVHYPIG